MKLHWGKEEGNNTWGAELSGGETSQGEGFRLTMSKLTEGSEEDGLSNLIAVKIAEKSHGNKKQRQKHETRRLRGKVFPAKKTAIMSVLHRPPVLTAGKPYHPANHKTAAGGFRWGRER